MLGWAGLTGRDGDEIKFQSPLISKCQAGWLAGIAHGSTAISGE